MAHGRRAGHGRVIGGDGRRALLDLDGEAAQLEGRAVKFAIQSGQAEAGFLVRQGHQLVAMGFERLGQTAQEGGADGSVAGAVTGKGRMGGKGSSIHIGRGGRSEISHGKVLRVQRTRQGRLGSKVQPGIRYCIARASSRAPRPCRR